MADLHGTWHPARPAASAPAARAPSVASAGGIEVLVDGQPRSREPGTAAGTPAEVVLRAYAAHGPAAFARLAGPFAAVVLDRPAGRAVLAVDRVGVRPLAYARAADGTLVFGTSALEVARAAAGAARVRLAPQALFDYLHLHMVPSPDTAYPGVRKLAPGTLATATGNGVGEERYWRPAFGPTPGDPADPRAELHRLLRVAVGNALAGARSPGAFLSGGLDSSTVVGVMAAIGADPVRTFSVGFNTEGYDELSYARIAVQRYGARGAEYIVTPEDVATALPVIASAYDEPFGNSSAIPTYFCAKLARSAGIDRLLAGDGGDEIFAGNPHYTRQALFEHYWRLPPALRPAWLADGLLRWIPEEAAWPLGKVRSYVQQARIPLPERLQSWNFMFREDRADIFTPDFLAQVDPRHPVTRMNETWAEVPDAHVVDRMLYFDWKFVLADSDLRKVGRMCELAGIEVRYPMLDTGLLEFSLGIPPERKIRGQELRHFYKEAMQGFLPDEILNKSKHGFGLPFGVWLKTSPGLIDLVAGSMASLATRGIFREDFLAGIQARHRDGHPGYFGYVIWDLLMLEQWLRAKDLGCH